MTQEAAKKERVTKVIEVLNKARSMELYAVHQYMNQHYNLDNLDYGEFASKIKLIAIDEMRHAEQFAERPVVVPDLADGHVDGRTEKRQLPDPAASGPQGRQRLPGPVAECRDDPYAPDGYVHLRFLRI